MGRKGESISKVGFFSAFMTPGPAPPASLGLDSGGPGMFADKSTVAQYYNSIYLRTALHKTVSFFALSFDFFQGW
jgi:hypothetical protein